MQILRTGTDGELRFAVDGLRFAVNNKFNTELEEQISGRLPKGHIYQLGRPCGILAATGVPDLPIELSSTRLEDKSKQENHPFDIADLKNLPEALHNPVAVFAYGDKNKAQNIIIEIQSGEKNFLVGLSLNYNKNGLNVNSIRGLFPKDLHEWLKWIQDGKSLYLNKEKVQNLITQQRINLADVSYLDLNSVNNIIQNFENPSFKEEKNIKFSIAPDLTKKTMVRRVSYMHKKMRNQCLMLKGSNSPTDTHLTPLIII